MNPAEQRIQRGAFDVILLTASSIAGTSHRLSRLALRAIAEGDFGLDDRWSPDTIAATR
jgi:hypothetical protein